MARHCNYKSIDNIKIIKLSDDSYKLEYGSDGWGLIGSYNDIISELSEHLTAMRAL